MKLKITVNKQTYDVEVEILDNTQNIPQNTLTPHTTQHTQSLPSTSPAATIQTSPTTTNNSQNALHSPIPGVVIKVLCQEGHNCTQDDTLLIIEAMKMETELKAPRSAKIKKIHTQQGATVSEGALLIQFEE